MIVRLRSSLETKRINVGSSSTEKDATWEQLCTAVQSTYALPPEVKIILSLDSEGTQRIVASGAEQLSDLNVTHGTVLFLQGKLQRTVAEKSYVGAEGNVVNRGDEVYEIVLEEEIDIQGEIVTSAVTVNLPEPSPRAEHEPTLSTLERKSVNTAFVAPSSEPLLSRLEIPPMDEDAGNFHFEEEGPMPSQFSPDVRRPDAVQRVRLVDDSPIQVAIPSPFRNIDLSQSMVRDIEMQSMLSDLSAFSSGSAQSSGSGSNSSSETAQARNSAALRLDRYTTFHGAGPTGSAPGVLDSFESDTYGNPVGTSYTGTMGKTAMDALRIDDLESDIADSIESHTSAITIDPDVAKALRGAGYSEYDILMELKQYEDEALARQLLGKQQQQQKFAQLQHGNGNGSASPLSQLLRERGNRPNNSSSGNSNSNFQDNTSGNYGSDRTGVSQRLFTNMRNNGDALTQLQDQADRVLQDARRLVSGMGTQGASTPEKVSGNDDLQDLRIALNSLSEKVTRQYGGERTTRGVFGADSTDDLERTIQESLYDVLPEQTRRPKVSRAGGSANTSTGQIKYASTKNMDKKYVTPASVPSATSITSASGLSNVAAVDEARKRLSTLMNNTNKSAMSTNPNSSKQKDGITENIRAANRNDSSRYRVTGNSVQDAIGEVGSTSSTRAERDKSRSKRLARGNARSNFYQEVDSFVQDDIAGGIRSRAAAASLIGREQVEPSIAPLGLRVPVRAASLSDEDDELAQAIKRSLEFQ